MSYPQRRDWNRGVEQVYRQDQYLNRASKYTVSELSQCMCEREARSLHAYNVCVDQRNRDDKDITTISKDTLRSWLENPKLINHQGVPSFLYMDLIGTDLNEEEWWELKHKINDFAISANVIIVDEKTSDKKPPTMQRVEVPLGSLIFHSTNHLC